MTLTVARVGPEAAEDVYAVVLAAFGTRPPLDPPADALSETVESLRSALGEAGGLLARLDGRPVGALLLSPDGDTLFLRRFGVVPDQRHRGVAHQLVSAACLAGVGHRSVAVLARQELPGTIGFWQDNAFREVSRAAPYVELRRPTGTPLLVPDPDHMHDLGRRLGEVLRAGDLVVLTGELGAGKTTLARGIGAGLGVRGAVTSPTFVIARVHPSLGGGPALVHADGYRLGGRAELDDLDLDASLEASVTVVEWGAGLAESLAESRLEVAIDRAVGGAASDDVAVALDPRAVVVTGIGPRWSR